MAAAENAVTLDIRGMTCASCVRRVERALGKIEGVDTASVNFAAETARVTLAQDVPLGTLVAAVEKAGYTATRSEGKRDPAVRDAELRKTLWTLLFGAALGVPTIIIAMALDIAGLTAVGGHTQTGWLLLALATPVQVGLGWRFYRGSWTSLRHLNPNMDVLVALGTSVAYVFSAWTVLAQEHRHMYFDVSAAVLVFITMGKYFEERAKGAASEAISALLGLAAKTATVVRDGVEVEVAADQVRKGNIFVVRPGQRIPVDGVLREGRGVVDESMITGESIPVERRPGDALLAGTINQDGLIRAEATAVGADTAVHRLAQMVEEAQGSKAPIQRLVDQVAAVFVPVVIVIALGVFLGWGLAGGDWMAGMIAAVAVLVVACPCALGLATPTAIMVGTGMGAERGILIRNAEVLERVRGIDTVVVDKTGTLTEGRPQVLDVVLLGGLDREALLRLAAAVESGSEHPLSRAVVDAAVDAGLSYPPVADFESVTASGVAGTVEGQAIAAGNRTLFASRNITVTAEAAAELDRLEAGGRTAIAIAVDGRVEGVLGIADAVKGNAVRAVEALHRMGLRVIMMTGDNERAARAVARAVGIEEVHAGARPGDKLALVTNLQAEGRKVAMVGDGINDAPALAKADIGVAMSTGTDVAIEAGGITLLHGDISKVAEAIVLGRSTLATIRQNLVWAFGYNVLAIPIAAAGLLNPIIAGAAMAFSSVSVMGNSLRLRARARRIAEQSGNSYGGPRQGFVSANRAPLLAMASSAAVLLLPLLVFTGVDRGWFSGGSDGDVVRVELTNWAVSPSRDSVPAGEVTFRAVHPGHAHGADDEGMLHNLTVVRLDNGGDTPLAGTKLLRAGESESITVDLEPGEYELRCDVVEETGGAVVNHYDKGMTAHFTVVS